MLNIFKKRSKSFFDDKVTINSTNDGRQSVNTDELLRDEEVQQRIAVLREAFMAEQAAATPLRRTSKPVIVEPEPAREAVLLNAEID